MANEGHNYTPEEDLTEEDLTDDEIKARIAEKN